MTNNLQKLLEQKASLDEKIAVEQEKHREAVRGQINNILKEHDFGLDELFDVRWRNPPRTAGGLFQDPDNEENTWGGRGRLPRWLAEKVAAGAKVEDFKVGGE